MTKLAISCILCYTIFLVLKGRYFVLVFQCPDEICKSSFNKFSGERTMLLNNWIYIDLKWVNRTKQFLAAFYIKHFSKNSLITKSYKYSLDMFLLAFDLSKNKISRSWWGAKKNGTWIRINNCFQFLFKARMLLSFRWFCF